MACITDLYEVERLCRNERQEGKNLCIVIDPRNFNLNKRQSRNTPGDSHYLTFSTYHRQKYLQDERICEALANRINEAAISHQFAVLAYVFMPDHVHLLVHPLEEVYSMSLILKSIKQGVSNKAKRQGWIETDLWERGGGYDRNVSSRKVRQNVRSYIHQNPVRKGLAEDCLQYRWSSARWYMTGEISDVKCAYYVTLFE